jgi:hypothetical protein
VPAAALPAKLLLVVMVTAANVQDTFGWLMQHRRLARDYETLPESSKTSPNALGWTRQVVWTVETGPRTVAMHEMPDICRALNVTLARLLGDADPEDTRRRLGVSQRVVSEMASGPRSVGVGRRVGGWGAARAGAEIGIPVRVHSRRVQECAEDA